eukprot:gene5159-7182_t
MSLYLLSALLLTLQVCLASTNSYTAGVSNEGAEGYFQMQLSKGEATYEVYLDLTGFSTSCDIASGLTYHIHSYWTDSAKSSTTTCSSAGGHYDPYLACGTSSEDKANLCVSLNRTVSQNYIYGCNPTDYAAGHYALCEVGDISGKFGKLLPAASGSLVFKASMVDPNPPLAVNYQTSDLISKQWASIVFHCPADNSRLFCAQLIRDKCSASEGLKC